MPLRVGQTMRRRDFILFLSSATVVAPLAARAQHAARPVIGFLSSSRPGADPPLIAALNGGLVDNGFVDGQNLTIDYRWADGRIDRLPTMAAEHVRRQVALIVAISPPQRWPRRPQPRQFRSCFIAAATWSKWASSLASVGLVAMPPA